MSVMLDLLLESFAERLGGWTGRLDRWARARGAPQHRSLESQTHIALQFENCTEHTVRVAWLDFQGLPVSYAILLPGSTTLQHSFATHAWTFEALSPPGWFMRSRATLPVLVCADTLAMVVYGEPAPAPKRVRICAASQRTWSPAAHAAHFDAYSKSVRTVLLIHASRRGRLSPAPPFSAAPDFELVTLLCAAARAHRGDAHILDEDRAHRSLADLPKDVVLRILALAAPLVYETQKPALPPCCAPLVTAAAREELFLPLPAHSKEDDV